jgi:hypothetical protein
VLDGTRAGGDRNDEPPDPPPEFRAGIERAWEIPGRLNALAPGDFGAMRALLGELTGRERDPASTSATTCRSARTCS